MNKNNPSGARKTIQDKVQVLINEFQNEVDWEARYKLIIDKGKRLPALEAHLKVEENLIKGCQSQVWLVASVDPTTKRLLLKGDSDALIVRGLVSLLLELYDDQSPSDVLKADLSFFEKIGLKSHLSPSRANGFNSMIKQIYNYALAFNYLNNKNN
ncbi:MAG: SufE family protein [Bdellovibrionaceae bacterium]|nr:SufE family protein [Pseudobdellovibrionaceae bacterium]